MCLYSQIHVFIAINKSKLLDNDQTIHILISWNQNQSRNSVYEPSNLYSTIPIFNSSECMNLWLHERQLHPTTEAGIINPNIISPNMCYINWMLGALHAQYHKSSFCSHGALLTEPNILVISLFQREKM